MTPSSRAAARPEDHELVITRVFDAPRHRVFRAWIEPEQLLHWWGPKGTELSHVELDVRPGGKWRKCMRTPEGKEFWRWGIFRDVTPPERLVFTYFSDDVHASTDHEMVITVTFADLNGKTKLTLRQTELESAASRESHQWGWGSSLERLETWVAQQ